jgi:hypothetical protein
MEEQGDGANKLKNRLFYRNRSGGGHAGFTGVPAHQ